MDNNEKLTQILLSLGLLMYVAYRGVNVLLIAPLLALLATLINGDARLLATLSQIYMKSLGGFVTGYFALFMLGAILGRLMADSGSAAVIASVAPKASSSAASRA